METFLEWPVWSALVRSLLHGVWQGGVISLLLLVILKCLPARRTDARYAASCGALLLLVVVWLVTWSWLERPIAIAPEPAAVPIVTVENFQPLVEGEFYREGGRGVAAGRPEASVSPLDKESWTGYFAALWIAGAAVFQLRTLQSLVHARALVRRSSAIGEGSVAAEFFALMDRLDLGRRVLLRESSRVVVPAVWGWLKPVLLVPPAFFSGMAPEQIQAILVHELAHIRRHDFAVNLLQKAIEGVLFFNPFVWLISRRIRLEREACCDAAAVRFCSRSTTYANALVGMATGILRERIQPESVLSAGRGSGELLERTRRVLDPAGRPSLGLSFRGAGGLLLMGLASLIVIKATAATAIAILSPEQRLERFVELRENYPDFRLEPNEEGREIQISGKVRAADGEALAAPVSIVVLSESENSSASNQASVDEGGRFFERVSAGKIHLLATTAGYAPKVLGPLEGASDLEDIDIVFERGHSARIHFIDPAGRAVPHVAVKLHADMGAVSPRLPDAVSSEEGILQLTNLGDVPLAFSVEAAGFETDSRDGVRLQAGEVMEWVLQPAAVVTGVVVFADTGEPVSEARIHLASRIARGIYSPGEPGSDNLQAVTDSEGRFELTTLRDGAAYHFMIVADGCAPTLVGPVTTGDRELQLEISRARYLKVQAVNVTPDDLDRRGRLVLAYRPELEFGETGHRFNEAFYAVPEDGRAEFEVGPLWATTARVELGDWEMEILGPHDPAVDEPVVIDMRAVAQRQAEIEEGTQSPATMRRIEIVLKAPADSPPPEGALVLEYHDQERGMVAHRVDLEGGRVRTSIPVAKDSTSVTLVADDLLGYWFPSRLVEVTAGESALIEELRVFPAGAVHGQVMEADGKPAGDISVAVVVTESPPEFPHVGIGDVRVLHPEKGRFLTTPLPLGATYRICAYRGFTFILSDPIALSEAEPFRDVVLTFSQGKELAVTLLRPDGTPFTEASVVFTYRPVENRGFGGGALWPDRDGKLVVEGVNADIPGHYMMEVRPDRDFRPIAREVYPGKPEIIRLEPGLVLEGRLVDAATGEPLEGLEVRAQLVWTAAAESNGFRWFEAEAPTNSDGIFRFSNLPSSEFRIRIRGARIIGAPRSVMAGAERPLELRVERGR